jgi:hypothetical protein
MGIVCTIPIITVGDKLFFLENKDYESKADYFSDFIKCQPVGPGFCRGIMYGQALGSRIDPRPEYMKRIAGKPGDDVYKLM